MPAAKIALPNPALFDPVRFPGAEEDEAWPPSRFDFRSAWMRAEGQRFERGASGGVSFVRGWGNVRFVLDIETAHSALDIAPRSHDFRLLRLVPSALRLVEEVKPGDAVPPPLLGEDAPEPGEEFLQAASRALLAALGQGQGEEGRALVASLRRVPPGARMFELAAALCVTEEGHPLARVAALAKGLQRLVSAHAGVLAAHAGGPDFEGMEKMVAAVRRVEIRDPRRRDTMLALALQQLERVIHLPRAAADRVHANARLGIVRAHNLQGIPALAEEQARARDRLSDINIFWRRCCAAWASVHAQTTDRWEIEELARNALRRLSLRALYETE